jgi:hypothetical protein
VKQQNSAAVMTMLVNETAMGPKLSRRHIGRQKDWNHVGGASAVAAMGPVSD